MTFEDYWRRRLDKSPGFANRTDDDVMRITVKALRAEVQLAYQTGREDGYRQRKDDELDTMQGQADDDQDTTLGWLKNVFGMKS